VHNGAAFAIARLSNPARRYCKCRDADEHHALTRDGVPERTTSNLDMTMIDYPNKEHLSF
jgi:hypothetical protein